MSKLDGTEKDGPVPFDAHDKVLRDSGDYRHQDYPKAVAHVRHPFGHLEPVVARDAKHEAELTKKKEK